MRTIHISCCSRVVVQDAANQFYVIVYVVVDAETRDNWKWFITLLESDIRNLVNYD